MWKKMGIVKAGESRSARSHLSKEQQLFQLFYDKHLAVPCLTPHKNNFCEDYMNRHHSADKHKPYIHQHTHSDHSLLAPTDSIKPEPHQNHDLVSLLRGHDLVKRKSSLQKQKMPENTLALLQQKLKKYRDKWQQTRQELLTLKKKQTQLKTQVTAELGKWKQAVERAVGELNSHAVIRKKETVQGALKAAKQFREGQERWRRQQKGILQRFNTTLQRLI